MPSPKILIQQLRDKIWYHAKKYYIDAAPDISDFEYDQLFAQLRALEQEHPHLVTPDSPTQRIAPEPVSQFERFEHQVPMISIDNCYLEEDVREFDTRLRKLLNKSEDVAYVVEPKVDGVAMSLWYENGTLLRGVTRGDGKVGEVVTGNVRTIRSIPLKLLCDTPPPLLEVRGEVFLSKEEFCRINEERAAQGESLFANPRNAAAGTLKLLDPREVSSRKLQFYIHSLGYIGELAVSLYSDALKLFCRWGLPVHPCWEFAKGIEAVLEKCRSWETKLDQLAYHIDGLVIKMDDLGDREEVGSTSHAPRWVLAYKFKPQEAQTQIQDVIVQIGKGGTLTPVAVLDPVFLAGTKVSRATLHNYEDVARKDIRVGDIVTIAKAGEIIPQVVKSHPEKRTGHEQPIVPPQNCPVCGGPVMKDAGGVFFRCQDPECKGGFKAKLLFFASRKGMEIKGLGPKLAEQLVDNGLVEQFSDLYRLTAEDMLKIEHMGEKNACKLVKAVQASKNRDLANVLFALGIRHVGEHVAQTLAQKFGTIINLAQAGQEELAAALYKTDASGGKAKKGTLAEAIYAYFRSSFGQRTIASLQEAGLGMVAHKKTKPAAGSQDTFWTGKTVVITGIFQTSRDEIKQAIIEGGGRVTEIVSGKTDIVLVGERPGSKFEQAQRFGVRLMREAEFLALPRPKTGGERQLELFENGENS